MVEWDALEKRCRAKILPRVRIPSFPPKQIEMIDKTTEDYSFSKEKITDWFKLVLIFILTPFTYTGWYYLVLSTPAIEIDNSATTIGIFWILTFIYFILLTTLIYLPLFKYSSTQTSLNKIQIINFIGASIFSVFFCVGVFYWHTFIFFSKSLDQAFRNLLVFSLAILASIGVVQLWFSTIAMQIVLWIKRKTVK